LGAQVLELEEKMGFRFQPHPDDVPEIPGSYYANHAELQLAVLAPDQPLGVSNNICREGSCPLFYRALAKYRNAIQIIADPEKARIFF
jgi:hypothetical protein